MSASPHIASAETTANIMRDVVFALMPALFCGVYFFGLYALLLVLLSVGSCLLFEYFFCKIRRIPNTISDWSAVVTGLLLGLNLPPAVPVYVPVIGGLFAIVIVKMLFGGLGRNFANPAITARVFLIMAWPALMVKFVGSAAVMALCFGGFSGILPALLSGGLMLGSIFMATDYATSPNTRTGTVIYAVFIGVLTIVLREYANYPEGMSFAILLGNLLVPLLDKFIVPRPFGYRKENKGKKEAVL